MAPTLGIDVAGPAETAWEVLVDLRWWPHWGPTVRDARLDDGATRLAAGATGRVQTPARVWLPFEVTTWREDERVRSWAWRVAGVPATTHTVTTLGPERCRVEMSAPWWAVGYLGVLGVALLRIRRLAEE
ncbi:SRPBCC family protein [Nocardioides solisilvae]|uniref:SRPBCC family protein n=1 Tax=Nocardioides solisilvae TaxID=1542435 RepID=UPI000D743A34|nr:SRPBCC family protein [Nocardioides solisilvae]